MSLNSVSIQLLELFDQLKSELTRHAMWANQPPADEALASIAPFACDTLAFEQWLQFIFMPKLQQMVEMEHDLPRKIAIRPMAEHVWASQQHLYPLIELTGRIDRLLGDHSI